MVEETIQYQDEIQKALAAQKAVIGAKVTLKKLRAQALKKIYLASNVSALFEEDIKYYTNMSGVEVEKLPRTAEELGIMVKKPFHITVIGVMK